MCLHGALCSIAFNLICNMTTFSKNDLTLTHPPQGSSVSVRTEHVLACCCICDLLLFDMQHDHILKTLNFDLLTPPPGS